MGAWKCLFSSRALDTSNFVLLMSLKFVIGRLENAFLLYGEDNISVWYKRQNLGDFCIEGGGGVKFWPF